MNLMLTSPLSDRSAGPEASADGDSHLALGISKSACHSGDDVKWARVQSFWLSEVCVGSRDCYVAEHNSPWSNVTGVSRSYCFFVKAALFAGSAWRFVVTGLGETSRFASTVPELHDTRCSVAARP